MRKDVYQEVTSKFRFTLQTEEQSYLERPFWKRQDGRQGAGPTESPAAGQPRADSALPRGGGRRRSGPATSAGEAEAGKQRRFAGQAHAPL